MSGTNPLLTTGGGQAAREYLELAVQYTPQYGDSFVELLRLGDDPEQACINADPNYGPLWLRCRAHPLQPVRAVLRHLRLALARGDPLDAPGPFDAERLFL